MITAYCHLVEKSTRKKGIEEDRIDQEVDKKFFVYAVR